MKRWINRGHYSQNGYGESPDVDAFLRDIIAICQRHGMGLGHQDSQGAFEVTTAINEEWILAANDCRKIR